MGYDIGGDFEDDPIPCRIVLTNNGGQQLHASLDTPFTNLPLCETDLTSKVRVISRTHIPILYYGHHDHASWCPVCAVRLKECGHIRLPYWKRRRKRKKT